MDKLETFKTAMQTALNTFFDTTDDTFIDNFYQSDFKIVFDNKTDGRKYTLNFSCSPEVWDVMQEFIKNIDESEELKDCIY